MQSVIGCCWRAWPSRLPFIPMWLWLASHPHVRACDKCRVQASWHACRRPCALLRSFYGALWSAPCYLGRSVSYLHHAPALDDHKGGGAVGAPLHVRHLVKAGLEREHALRLRAHTATVPLQAPLRTCFEGVSQFPGRCWPHLKQWACTAWACCTCMQACWGAHQGRLYDSRAYGEGLAWPSCHTRVVQSAEADRKALLRKGL